MTRIQTRTEFQHQSWQIANDRYGSVGGSDLKHAD